MKIYWGYKDVPELAGLSRRERSKVVRTCLWKFGFRHWQSWLAWLVFLVIGELGLIIGDTLRHKFGQPSAVYYACGSVGVIIGSTIFHHVLTDQLRPHFRDYIAGK
jgi:hypothetical protein